MTFEDYSDIKGLPKPTWFAQGLFVYPPNKFAFCLIEKNACSTWISTVLQPLLTGKPAPCKTGSSAGDCRSGINWFVAQQSRAKFGQKGIESIFQDPGATRAVFVRDPMQRFASAFFNKCYGDQRNCPLPDGKRKFRDAVEWALAHNMSAQNPHWLPQADHCELKTRIQGYNVIGLMESDTFEEDMNCVLAKAGLNGFIKQDHVSRQYIITRVIITSDLRST